MNKWWIIGIIVIVGACCLGLLVCGVIGGGLAIYAKDAPIEEFHYEFQKDLQSNPKPSGPFPSPTPQIISGVSPEGAMETLQTLKDTLIPVNDPRDLAARLKGEKDIPLTVDTNPGPRNHGEEDLFWVTNTDTNETFQVKATLRYVGDNVYFWIENGVRYNQTEVEKLIKTFDQKTYATTREFFGSEWNPGIDNDPRLYILYARGGGSVGGYFSSMDSVHPLVHPYSNAHELFFISADYVDLGDESAYGTLAHEFQHMIHWYRDRNEESWLNEGFSMLSELLNGYDPGYVDDIYLQDPDIQLTYWPSGEESYPHYGAAFLFVTYFLDRFGEDATKELVSDQDNGLDSVDNVLERINAVDELTGSSITADDVFADWTVTNFLNDPGVADGRYAYRIYNNLPSTYPGFDVGCSSGRQTFDVHQFGVDYIELDCSKGKYELVIDGSSVVKVIPEDPISGDYYYWSNKGDESNMTLSREFDFAGVTGAITLNYWTWFDIEKDYDFLYLLASSNGEDWDFLHTPSGTDSNTTGNNYGWGYNGSSNGWIEEKVDVSQYAGKKVTLQFEYVTDAAVNGEGLLLDDISISEIGYFSDFEEDHGGWVPSGFVRIQNRLPQEYIVSVINQGDTTMVESYRFSGDDGLRRTVDFNENDRVIIIVSGATRFTHQIAGYQISLIPAD